MVGDGVRPEGPEIAGVDDREHGGQPEQPRRPGSEGPRRRSLAISRARIDGSAVNAVNLTSTAPAKTAPAGSGAPGSGEPEARDGERHRGGVGEDQAAVLREQRRDGDQPGGEETATRPCELAAEQVGGDRAERSDRNEPQPDARDRDAEDGSDRLEQDVEAGALRGEHVAAERRPVAQVVEADEVDAFVEGRRGVEEPGEQDDEGGDDHGQRGELGRDERAWAEPHARAVPAVFPVSQSTRPTQLSRLAAYQAIVRRTPSSHEIFGSQPVSAFSFS